MKTPSLLKSFRNRTFFQSSVFSLLFFSVLAFLFWQAQAPGTPPDLQTYGYMFAFVYLFNLLQWMFQKNTLFHLLRKGTTDKPEPAATPVTKPAKSMVPADQDRQRNHEKRLFVHLFAALQRQGRLMDFLQEDLSRYQDAQIGAAVRSIHDNCRKTVDRYLSPLPVMEEKEGDRVRVQDDFDQHAIKLVGNVVGEPPFTGVVRHRGWQLKTIRMPSLSETDRPEIIAPAEVEVQ